MRFTGEVYDGEGDFGDSGSGVGAYAWTRLLGRKCYEKVSEGGVDHYVHVLRQREMLVIE
ncbi:hypothetical protein [Nocardia brevicatena]|uniref:hypothetical protein n=1 Tax=Nocardia brevicatena TaxID=37327 RepID=UPI000305B428|nr:hypothetical protein [Nocardia brevicatena]